MQRPDRVGLWKPNSRADAVLRAVGCQGVGVGGSLEGSELWRDQTIFASRKIPLAAERRTGTGSLSRIGGDTFSVHWRGEGLALGVGLMMERETPF